MATKGKKATYFVLLYLAPGHCVRVQFQGMGAPNTLSSSLIPICKQGMRSWSPRRSRSGALIFETYGTYYGVPYFKQSCFFGLKERRPLPRYSVQYILFHVLFYLNYGYSTSLMYRSTVYSFASQLISLMSPVSYLLYVFLSLNCNFQDLFLFIVLFS